MSTELFKDNCEANNAFKILIRTNQAVFLTGGAGTGKSTFIEWAKSISNTNCCVLAPTGVSARNIDGETIQSALKFRNEFVLADDEDFFSNQRFTRDDEFLLYHADLVIIDEISMVSSATLDSIDRTFQKICLNDKPFGGKKVLFVGDPFQLPPVVTKEEKPKILKRYKSEFFFDSVSWKKLNPIHIELKKNYRQTDTEFYGILNSIRRNIGCVKALDVLNKSCFVSDLSKIHDVLGSSITLTFRKVDARQINDDELRRLDGSEKVFEENVSGAFARHSCLAEEILRLKIGARVMLIKNHPARLYFNGTVGFIRAIKDDELTIETNDGKIISVRKAIWETKKNVITYSRKGTTYSYETVGMLTQFPVILAWAITVHKSQGLSFDNVFFLNSSNSFASGQAYVALSRCRSVEGLRLKTTISMRDVKPDPRIVEFSKETLNTKRVDEFIQETDDEKVLDQLPLMFDINKITEVLTESETSREAECVDEFIQRSLDCNRIKKVFDYSYEKVFL